MFEPNAANINQRTGTSPYDAGSHPSSSSNAASAACCLPTHKPARVTMFVRSSRGYHLRMLSLVAGQYAPPQQLVPVTVRLDSLLFDADSRTLKPGSTKEQINALVNIKPQPGCKK